MKNREKKYKIKYKKKKKKKGIIESVLIALIYDKNV